jgi:hypothetical protein
MGDEWLNIGMNCQECGKPLIAKRSKVYSSISIKGLIDLDYKHEDGTQECVIIRTPRPWDGWRASDAFEKAQRASWADE